MCINDVLLGRMERFPRYTQIVLSYIVKIVRKFPLNNLLEVRNAANESGYNYSVRLRGNYEGCMQSRKKTVEDEIGSKRVSPYLRGIFG